MGSVGLSRPLNCTVTKRSIKSDREIRFEAYELLYLQHTEDDLELRVGPERIKEVLDTCDNNGFFDIPSKVGKFSAIRQIRQSGHIQSITYDPNRDGELCDPISLTFEEYVRFGYGFFLLCTSR